MKLKDFPLVFQGCTEIFYDNHSGPADAPRPHGEASIPPSWEKGFFAAEHALETVKAKWPRLRDIPLFDQQALGMWFVQEPVAVNDDDQFANTLHWIWLGQDESASELMDLANIDDASQFCVEHLFNEYFDGELKHVLEK